MRTFLVPFMSFVLSAGLLAACSSSTGPDIGPETRPFELTEETIELDWSVTRDQEQSCGGDEIGGGAISGTGTFTDIGQLEIEMSSVWDIGNLLDPGAATYEPEGPAGGPVAPVLGADQYPYDLQFNPLTLECEPGVSATGELLLTGTEGDVIQGLVTGGETHRLDFVVPGDGIESFQDIEFAGGTGRFEGATGSAVFHTIARFDPDTETFVLDLAEVLPDGEIEY